MSVSMLGKRKENPATHGYVRIMKDRWKKNFTHQDKYGEDSEEEVTAESSTVSKEDRQSSSTISLRRTRTKISKNK